MEIHPTAIVDPRAKIGEGTVVGPYSVIEGEVTLESGCWVGPHVVIRGPASIGSGTRIFQFSSIGEEPQDKKFDGEHTWLEIGTDNTIREGVTINRGTGEGGGVTRIGDRNWIMAYVHIAHDCLLGNEGVFANGTSLAGHVCVGDAVTLGGFTLVHQFCQLGEGCFTSMGSCIRRDVPPWVMVSGDPGQPHGINSEGLKRRGFDSEARQRVRTAYKMLYRQGRAFHDAIDSIEALSPDDPVLNGMAHFLRASSRGVVR